MATTKFVITRSAPTVRAETFPAVTGPLGGVPVGLPQPDAAPPSTTSPVAAPANIRSSRRLTARLEQVEQRSGSSLVIVALRETRYRGVSAIRQMRTLVTGWDCGSVSRPDRR